MHTSLAIRIRMQVIRTRMQLLLDHLDLILVVHGISANQTSFFRYNESQVQLSLY